MPNNLGFTKSTIAKYSLKLFCSGVPVKIMRRFVLILFIVALMAVFVFLRICPSSHTTICGPGSINVSLKTSLCFFLNFLSFSRVRFLNIS